MVNDPTPGDPFSIRIVRSQAQSNHPIRARSSNCHSWEGCIIVLLGIPAIRESLNYCLANNGLYASDGFYLWAGPSKSF
jgi:hypothetical protein